MQCKLTNSFCHLVSISSRTQSCFTTHMGTIQLWSYCKAIKLPTFTQAEQSIMSYNFSQRRFPLLLLLSTSIPIVTQIQRRLSIPIIQVAPTTTKVSFCLSFSIWNSIQYVSTFTPASDYDGSYNAASPPDSESAQFYNPNIMDRGEFVSFPHNPKLDSGSSRSRTIYETTETRCAGGLG
jgi:hypothetical protein